MRREWLRHLDKSQDIVELLVSSLEHFQAGG